MAVKAEFSSKTIYIPMWTRNVRNHEKLRAKLQILQVNICKPLNEQIPRGCFFTSVGPPRGLAKRWNCWSLKKKKRNAPLILMLISMIKLIFCVRRMKKKITTCAQLRRWWEFLCLPCPAMRTYDLYQLCQEKKLPFIWMSNIEENNNWLRQHWMILLCLSKLWF